MASIDKLPSGKFRVRWRDHGKFRTRSFEDLDEANTFSRSATANPRSPAGAMRRRDAALERMRASRASNGPTVVAFGREVCDDPALKPLSRDMYKHALNAIERADIGAMEVAKVSPADVRAYFRMVTKNRANIRSTLSKVFRAAEREGLRPDNPMTRAAIKLDHTPKRHADGMRILTVDEVERLADATTSERDALAVRLGAYVGLRAGEVGGLRLQDLDVERCRLYIRRNAVKADGQGTVVGTPKTKASVRDLAVDCDLVKDIVAFAEKHEPLADGTLFYTSERRPVTNDTVTKVTTKAAKRAGLRRVTFHDLRHTCASLLIAAKVEPKTLQAYLGHSSIRMTFDVYGHLFPRSDEAIAEAMGAARRAARR
jgi:integrase